MADWLQQATDGLNALPAHETVRDLLWVVPTSQTIHIISVAIIFSASLLVALRALGIAGTYWTLGRWQDRFAGWNVVALILLTLSGAVLILAEPERELLNSLFQIKIPLVIATSLLSFGIGRRFNRDSNGRTSAGAKAGAVLIFLLWAIIMGLGRWIAYAG